MSERASRPLIILVIMKSIFWVFDGSITCVQE
jgi:hypothetical protein